MLMNVPGKKKEAKPEKRRGENMARSSSLGSALFAGSVCNLLRAVGKIYSNEKQPRSEKDGL